MDAERKEALANQINRGQMFIFPLTLSLFAAIYWFVGFTWMGEEGGVLTAQ